MCIIGGASMFVRFVGGGFGLRPGMAGAACDQSAGQSLIEAGQKPSHLLLSNIGLQACSAALRRYIASQL